jgi:large subunit ribosomal protein L23
MHSDPLQVIKAPLLSEEATIQQESKHQYVFRVDPRATKVQIRDAVEKAFKVRVTSVNTMNYRGKARRRGRILGRRPDWKKAVVTLHADDTIDLI